MKAVSLRLYDSLRRDTVEFSPIKPGHVSMYVCGPTVQSAPHVGHIRSALVYDLWWRWLEHRGYQVTLVRNVTDIDDKILEKSAESGENWWQLAHRVETEFAHAASTLRIRTPHHEPRATGDIPAMIEMISQLIDRGHAYVADDQSGDVYFDVASWPEYGALTNQSTDDMEPGETATAGKRSPHDFALWKGHKSGEPDTAQWDAPWGSGRPGGISNAPPWPPDTWDPSLTSTAEVSICASPTTKTNSPSRQQLATRLPPTGYTTPWCS